MVIHESLIPKLEKIYHITERENWTKWFERFYWACTIFGYDRYIVKYYFMSMLKEQEHDEDAAEDMCKYVEHKFKKLDKIRIMLSDENLSPPE